MTMSVIYRMGSILAMLPLLANAQLIYAFNSTSLTSLNYNGTEYSDSTNGGGISYAANGLPFIPVWTRPDGSTYAGSFFSCSKLTRGITGQTVTVSCPTGDYHFSYTYSQPDSSTLKVALTLYNDSSTDTITQVAFPFAGIVLPHPYASNRTGIGNPTPVSGIFDNFLTWGAAESVVFSDATAGWYISSQVTANTPDTDHDEVDFYFQNQESSGNCTYFCQTYSASVAPLGSATVNGYIRFGPANAEQSTLEPELISAWSTAYPPQLNWTDRRPIGQLFLANGSGTSSSNPRGWLAGSACNCTDQPTFHAWVQSYIAQVLRTVASYSFRLQGFIFWDLEGEESPSLNFVGDPRTLPVAAPEMNAEADAMMSQLVSMGYRVGMTLRASHFNTGASLPPTPCTYYNVASAVNGYLQPPFMVAGQVPPRVYTCDPSTLRWGLGGYQATWEYQSQAASDIIAKATYAHNRWGASLFYVDSSTWVGDGAFSPDAWAAVEAALPDCLFIPEESTAGQLPYASAYNDSHLSGSYNSAERGFQVPYPYGFIVSFSNGTDMTKVPTIAAGIRHGDIYGLQAWYNSGEAGVIGAAIRESQSGGRGSEPGSLMRPRPNRHRN